MTDEKKKDNINIPDDIEELLDELLDMEEKATEEAEGIENYDYIVINDNLEECVREMHGLIMAAHETPARNQEFINKVRKELEAFTE